MHTRSPNHTHQHNFSWLIALLRDNDECVWSTAVDLSVYVYFVALRSLSCIQKHFHIKHAPLGKRLCRIIFIINHHLRNLMHDSCVWDSRSPRMQRSEYDVCVNPFAVCRCCILCCDGRCVAMRGRIMLVADFFENHSIRARFGRVWTRAVVGGCPFAVFRTGKRGRLWVYEYFVWLCVCVWTIYRCDFTDCATRDQTQPTEPTAQLVLKPKPILCQQRSLSLCTGAHEMLSDGVCIWVKT